LVGRITPPPSPCLKVSRRDFEHVTTENGEKSLALKEDVDFEKLVEMCSDAEDRQAGTDSEGEIPEGWVEVGDSESFLMDLSTPGLQTPRRVSTVGHTLVIKALPEISTVPEMSPCK